MQHNQDAVESHVNDKSCSNVLLNIIIIRLYLRRSWVHDGEGLVPVVDGGDGGGAVGVGEEVRRWL
jgi:hypothetical protein